MANYPTDNNAGQNSASNDRKKPIRAKLWVLPLTAIILGTLFMSLVMMGCGPHAQATGITGGGATWVTQHEDPTPGIHNAAVSIITLFNGPDKGVKFVVWSDLLNRTDKEGTNSAAPSSTFAKRSLSYQGRHSISAGPTILFDANTPDGVSGTIKFDETIYDLANGKLFLVSSQQHPPEVLQLDIDTANMPNGMGKLLEFAKENEPIEAFFQKHKPLPTDNR